MRSFCQGTDEAFRDLEQRATQACIRFDGCELPPGCTPSRASVGFEVDGATGLARLLVQPGVRYSGSDEDLQGWASSGALNFRSFADLRRWICSDLSTYFARPAPTASAPAPQASGPGHQPIETICDLSQVQVDGRTSSGALYIDPDALFDQLATRVRGQDPALRHVSGGIARHLAKVNPGRPATMFAIGPTGVGKTLTAESLPEALQAVLAEGDTCGYLRLDMNEYKESSRVSQLLGAPQSYIGYGEGAQLVDTLAANPRTIVLFDEIEKAHPDILHTLMNAMDAGRLSSAARVGDSRELDVRQAIFIFTSNLKAHDVLAELSERDAFDDATTVDEVARRHLVASGIAPELVGRIGAFLPYRPLGPEHQVELVAMSIDRVAREFGVQLGRIEPSVVSAILPRVQAGSFGVRPAERVVENVLGEALMRAAGSGETGPMVLMGEGEFECVPVVEGRSVPDKD